MRMPECFCTHVGWACCCKGDGKGCCCGALSEPGSSAAEVSVGERQGRQPGSLSVAVSGDTDDAAVREVLEGLLGYWRARSRNVLPPPEHACEAAVVEFDALVARLRDTEEGDGKQSRETPASAGDVGAAATPQPYREGDRCSNCHYWWWDSEPGWHSLVPKLYAGIKDEARAVVCPVCVESRGGTPQTAEPQSPESGPSGRVAGQDSTP